MAIHVALHHRTHYKYDRAVNLGPQVIRLRPAPHSRTRILSYSLRVAPKTHFLNWQQDPQSNYLARVVFPEKATELCVEVDVVAEMAVFNPFDFFLEPGAERFPFSYDHILDHELEPYQLKCELTPKFSKYLDAVRREIIHPATDDHPSAVPMSEKDSDTHHHGQLPEAGQLNADEDKRLRTIDFLVNINQRLWHDIKYLIRLEPGVQTPEETLVSGSGSCRDSAWLLCQLMRHCGLASRFVSGYLIQLVADVKSLDGPSGTEKDFTDLHAWCEVYLPGAGWVGLDPTSGLLAGEGHVPLAAAPDPSSAAPITGLIEECECEFSHEMTVTRIHESPRVTKPYTEEQWAQIEALGYLVDADLRRNDVRLTMGGEPTFVSIDDFDGAEWNTVAMGPTKRHFADDLIRRLQGLWAPGALLHYGQGKWYPGESLPRWSFACYWRKDGEAIWEDHSLIADEKHNYGFNSTHSQKFLSALAERLEVDPQWIMPGYEDAWYYMWKERRLPSNVDPHQSNLKDKEERVRIAKIFEQGLDAVVGHVVPIQRQIIGGKPAWASGPWFLRPERMYLIPGDSPMGFRLSLDSLPWVTAADYPYIHETDPSAERPPLPSRAARGNQRFVAGAGSPGGAGGFEGFGPGGQALPWVKPPYRPGEDPTRRPAAQQSSPWIIRTALCVEARNGRLHVFMPPVSELEDYIDLVATIEDTAASLKMPVMIEGYTPPHDPRLNVLKVTPDPGVIEVNLPPSSDWKELTERTTTLYEQARQARLGAEKFMVDGRHGGTGGGNHIIVGGATPSDSPILRRPDLLRSLLNYWQNHPSLSYLFSGLFIGPTSQSPRVDEARNDSLYELELAFKQIPDKGSVPPWLVDRLFRNLLIDTTGNTHRAEFCIDKLYTPEGGAGRLGLLEMRAFEMPPNSQMSLAQHLMLRALVSRFWQEPYHKPLVRWGTGIHDRWMMPHFIWQDLGDIVQDLQGSGYAMQADWFKPHFEFRFPFAGDYNAKGIHLELRHALEPWHVLGEEPGAGGTVRYVDSSVERMQVKVRGATDSRHVVTVNGHALPLHPTGVNGEFVAGVRYRAWQPSTCLHPTIPVHSPLTVDVVDTWNDRSVGGCTYHVMHPGGRSYSTFPVNSYEAESRRLARFFRHGHSQGKLSIKPPVVNPEFPFTLDLRNT
ncbi:MAG TPA: transglutaminase family protein [Roseimicrobium sp.]|nr:transglutaminase family protein [Roseimicrobium sp.]